MFALVCLASVLSIMFSRAAGVVAGVGVSSLRLHNIPLCVRTRFCLSVELSTDTEVAPTFGC